MIASDMIATRTEIAAENGLVTGGDPLECEAGIAMLRAGGNAIDAVVAAAFVGFVVEPASCGIGGYGRLALFLAERRKFLTVDHYVRAPAAARPDMYRVDPSKPAKYYGFPHTEGLEAEVGHRAVAVPGAVAGLCAAHERLGRLKLAQVLEPAIAIAEAGLPVTWQLALGVAERLTEIRRFPQIAAFLLCQDAPPRAPGQFGGGDRLDCRDLARTLRRIAEHGPAGFHDGPVAAAIERECRAHGGILTAADLAAYRPRIFEETPATYRGLAYTTADDLVSYEALNILERFDLAGLGADSAGFRHVMAEALAAAFIDNMTHYGDPEFVTSPIKGLGSKDFAAMRAAGIGLDRVLPRPVVAADPWPFDDAKPPTGRPARGPSHARIAGTSQMAAVDRWGNMASLTTSLSSGFGSLVLVPETGIVLNNSMQNFDPRPDQANAIAPGKMPIFAAPTMVAARDGTAVFAGCGSGGYRIETGVLHAFVHAVDFAMGAQAAVDAPRVHCQGQQTFVDGRVPEEVRDKLAAMGHDIAVQRDSPGLNAFGRINAITLDPKTKIMRAGTGPAWGTAAAGY